MSAQLSFDLPRRPALGREDFVVADANALALALIDRPGDWPNGRLVLIGDRGAGKTHLVHVWAAAAGGDIVDAGALSKADIPMLAKGAVAVEDMDQAAGTRAVEEALFHLLNLAQAEGGTVLVTAKAPVRDWQLGLPDLESRLTAAQSIQIDPPDDALLAAVLMKLFAERQLRPTPDAVTWLLKRLTRRFDVVNEAVDRLDAQALSTGRAINRALTRDLLIAAPHLFD